MIASKSTQLNLCPNCNHNNRMGVLICENCGRSIFDNIFGSTLKMKPQERPAQQVQAITSVGTHHLKTDTAIIMHIADAPTPIKFNPKTPLVLGRVNSRNPRRPDIDLSAYRAFEKGVSCHHATVQRQDDQLIIADMGSTNGTCVNGDRLNPPRTACPARWRRSAPGQSVCARRLWRLVR